MEDFTNNMSNFTAFGKKFEFSPFYGESVHRTSRNGSWSIVGRSWGDHRPLLPAGLHWTPRCREGLPFAAATSGCRSSKSSRSSCSNGIGPKAIRSPKGVRMRLQDDIGDSEILLKIDHEFAWMHGTWCFFWGSKQFLLEHPYVNIYIYEYSRIQAQS